MNGLPALLRSPVQTGDHITIVKNPAKVGWMILDEYESGAGRLFRDEGVAKSFAAGRTIVKIKMERSGD